MIGLLRKPSYSVSFLHRIFLLSYPHTIILDISDEHVNSRLGHLSFEYPGSAGAGPRQVAPEQGPQEAILKELRRHEPRNQQSISMGSTMTNHAAQLAIIKQVTRQESRSSAGIVKQMSRQESRSSAGNCHADESAGITQLSRP